MAPQTHGPTSDRRPAQVNPPPAGHPVAPSLPRVPNFPRTPRLPLALRKNSESSSRAPFNPIQDPDQNPKSEQDFGAIWSKFERTSTKSSKTGRTPAAPRRTQPKSQAPASSSSGVHAPSNSTLTAAGASLLEDTRAQNVVDEFYQPVNPTLGQIVRQKLSEGRNVTCRLAGVILEESSPEELQKQVTVKYSVLETLLEITKCCDLYLMERVMDDETENKVLSALEDAGAFTCGLVKEKVLFCSTKNRRTSFIRQLEPDWHIDSRFRSYLEQG